MIFNHPIAGRVLGGAALRLAGVDPRVMVELYTEAEKRRAAKMSFEELAQDALAAKNAAA